MARSFTVGIDLGTATTRCVVIAMGPDGQQVLTATAVASRGVRHGYITSIPDAAASIRAAVDLAEKEAGITIKRAVFSIGGVSLAADIVQGSAIISKSDGEITPLDTKAALAVAEETLGIKNRETIFRSTLGWKLDGKDIPGKPEGMHGVKLEVKILHVTCLSQHLDDLITAAAEAEIEVTDVIPSSVAASTVALTDRQKAVGVMLVNIGAETVSIAVFENNILIGLSVLPIGSTDITNDIALGFRIPLDEAEGVKTGSIISNNYPRRKVEEIIEARFVDIFELIDNYLKRIKRSGLLPAGVVITGGGSGNTLVEGLAKDLLRLPSRVGTSDIVSSIKGPMRDASWFVVFGLALAAQHPKRDGRAPRSRGAKGLFKEFLRQFLP